MSDCWTRWAANTHRIAAALGCLLAGCAANPDGANPPDGVTGYTERIGLATLHDLDYRLPRVLAEHGYSIAVRDETAHSVSYETAWERRDPFPDEAELDARDARTRITIRAGRMETYYAVRFYSRSEILTANGWEPVQATRMFRLYAAGIVRDMHLELASGIRRH